jgi:Ca2+-transporting ATPase
MKYLGHTSKEAEEILKAEGENTLYESKDFPLLKSILASFKEPMMLLLLLACLIYFFIGKFTDFLILTISAFIILNINIFQNYKTESAIKKLKSLSQKFSEVIRDGEKIQIPSEKIVRGDIILISEGERIPADVLILESSNLAIDESILTGESIPVKKESTKYEASLLKNKKIDNTYLAFSGSIVISGWLIGSVYTTGQNTKIGKMGIKLSSLVDEEPLVKKEIDVIVKNLATIALITCSFVFIYGFYSTGDWVKPILNSVTLAIALVPEELPIVLTIFLALSSVKLSKSGLIIRNKSIIETLGAANILCVDKTGTITKNKMKLSKIVTLKDVADGESKNWNKDVIEIIKSAYLAKYFNSKDSLDSEIERVFNKLNMDSNDYYFLNEKILDQKFVFSRQYSFNNQNIIFAKGAFDEIIKLSKITTDAEKFIYDQFFTLTNQGLRVVAVAVLENKNIKSKFSFLGLLAFEDEIRQEVPATIKLCQDNSIRVCMITGDHKNTAIYYAKKIGLNNPLEVITGDELENLPNHLLDERIKNSNVFARIRPEQKLRILNLLKSSGNIVAMTGDGVNDALALKSAHIGISIGEGASDIAKETSDMVLTANNLKNIVDGVIEGRRVYDNLSTTARYIYSFHLPIILISIFNVLFKLPELLLPIHITLLEFIIDPFSTLVFQSIPGKKGQFSIKPRKGKFKLVENMNLPKGSIYGFLIFIFVFITYYLYVQENVVAAQTISLFLILGLNMVLIYLNYSETLSMKELIKNKVYMFSNIALITAVFAIYFFREALNLTEISYNLTSNDLITIFSLIVTYLILGKIAQKTM